MQIPLLANRKAMAKSTHRSSYGFSSISAKAHMDKWTNGQWGSELFKIRILFLSIGEAQLEHAPSQSND